MWPLWHSHPLWPYASFIGCMSICILSASDLLPKASFRAMPEGCIALLMDSLVAAAVPMLKS